MIDQLLSVLYPEGIEPKHYLQLSGVICALEQAVHLARDGSLLDEVCTKAMERTMADDYIDPIDLFLEQRTTQETGHTPLTGLYVAYRTWATEQDHTILSCYDFRQALLARQRRVYPLGSTTLAVENTVLR